MEIKRDKRFRLPQAQRIDALAAISNDGHVIGHRPHCLVAKLNAHTLVFPAHTPRVAPRKPIVRFLLLASIREVLLKKAVTVADAIPIQRDILRGSAVQEAGGETAQTAVAQRIVFHFLKNVRVDAIVAQKRFRLLEQAEIQEVAVNQAADKKFGGKIAGDFAGNRLLPCLIAAIHCCGGDGIVELFGRSFFQWLVVKFFGFADDCLLKRLHNVPPNCVLRGHR